MVNLRIGKSTDSLKVTEVLQLLQQCKLPGMYHIIKQNIK